jgi:uncharacterized protein YgiB involved in biofilm formation
MDRCRPSESVLPMPSLPSVALAGLAGVALALAGCSDGGSKTAAKPANTRGVIASAGDCISFGPEAVKACAAAIERAVAAHEASSAAYTNIEACESAVGDGRCERSASGTYRARLSAFMVTVGSGAARAEPLYPAKDSGVGFRTASNGKVLASDQSLTFSRLALSVAETQAVQGKTGKRRRKN